MFTLSKLSVLLLFAISMVSCSSDDYQLSVQKPQAEPEPVSISEVSALVPANVYFGVIRTLSPKREIIEINQAASISNGFEAPEFKKLGLAPGISYFVLKPKERIDLTIKTTGTARRIPFQWEPIDELTFIGPDSLRCAKRVSEFKKITGVGENEPLTKLRFTSALEAVKNRLTEKSTDESLHHAI